MTTERATCWSITINNPKDTDVLCAIAGWHLQGQYEMGESGTRHFQGMLETPQVRFSAVKKAFPTAHIEIARNRAALAKYVSKPETRVGNMETQMNIFTAQQLIASKWDNELWSKKLAENFMSKYEEKPIDDMAMDYLDELVAAEIEKGTRCMEFIAINPMWRSSWKKFHRYIIERYAREAAQFQIHEAQRQEIDEATDRS